MNEVDFEGWGGIHIAGEVWGPEDADPVLLAHGGGQSRLAWRETAVRLAAAGYRAVAIDLGPRRRRLRRAALRSLDPD